MIHDRPCTVECIWIGEDCVKASAQKLSGYMEESLERKKLVQDMEVQSAFNDSSVNLASSLMSGVEGLAFITAELLSAGYNASINEKFLYIDVQMWEGGRSKITTPEVSKDLTEEGVQAYLDFVSDYIPCKLQG
jgi:hypothetical protein